MTMHGLGMPTAWDHLLHLHFAWGARLRVVALIQATVTSSTSVWADHLTLVPLMLSVIRVTLQSACMPTVKSHATVQGTPSLWNFSEVFCCPNLCSSIWVILTAQCECWPNHLFLFQNWYKVLPNLTFLSQQLKVTNAVEAHFGS